jgi:hypothetical protein
MSKLILTLLLPVLVSGVAFSSGPIREGSFSAESDGSTIVIRWISEDETNVTAYELERKAGLYNQFFLLSVVDPLGNNTAYEYMDDSALRVGAESIYIYRVKVRFADGTTAYSPEITVVHAVSSVRRTWGSIKAMFR